MALYKYADNLHQNSHEAFDAELSPGIVVSNSGIYRCVNCGDETACNKDNPLPPQNHHQHAPERGPIRWTLLVCAIQQ